MVDNKSREVQTQTYSGVLVRGLQIPPRFSPCKTHSREMPQSLGFDPTIEVKTCFECKIFDVANWVAFLNGENYPRGTPSHDTLSVRTKGLWSDREKRLHINVLELKAVSLALQRFKDQCQNQTVLVATANSTVVAYINKQGGAQSAEMCAFL